MEERSANTELMVPLTSSLYVPGELADNTVMVECGAGYYMEKNLKDAGEYCDRKSKGMSDNVAKVSEYMQIKKQHMTNVQVEYNKRMQAMQQLQAEQ
jgi:prefoldin alpha subunit